MNKPPYCVPSMEEIEAMPWNGYNIVSTFSGAGGSCLGFRMAGFRTLWASEFVPAAQEIYRLNYPSVYLDTRDIRQVQPEEILEQIGLERGQVDVLEGSPPCASFSTAGKREAGWGQVCKYSDTQQRVDDLFFEFARILKGLQPKVFVAENVSGLVKGKAKGYFKLILQELKDCGYNVRAKVLDAQWLGVPQQRQRVIFIGTRQDLGLEPVYPKPLGYRYSVREAIPWIVRTSIRDSKTLMRTWYDADRIQSPTVSAQQPYNPETSTQGMYIVEAEIDPRRFVEDTGGEWGMGDISDRPSPTVRQGGVGHLYVIEPETDISRFAIGREWDKLEPGEKSEKYFNLVRAHPEKPSPAVTQKAGTAWSPAAAAGVTHPTEKRKFSIAELKRISAFPDDFKLTGSYSQQWERLGRAVPPVMMYHIAKTIRDEMLERI